MFLESPTDSIVYAMPSWSVDSYICRADTGKIKFFEKFSEPNHNYLCR